MTQKAATPYKNRRFSNLQKFKVILIESICRPSSQIAQIMD